MKKGFKHLTEEEKKEQIERWNELKKKKREEKKGEKKEEENGPDTVECNNCGKSVRKSYLSRHMKTKACISSK